MSWHTKTVEIETLERELNAFAEQGYEVFQVLPLSNSHSCIVAKLPAAVTTERPEQDEKYYGAKPKKGKKS